MKLLVFISLTASFNVYSHEILNSQFQKNYQTEIDSTYKIFESAIGEDSMVAHGIGRNLLRRSLKEKNDSLVIVVAYELGQSLISWRKIDEGKAVINQLIDYAYSRKLSEGLSYAYKGLGDAAQNASKFDSARYYFKKAEPGWKASKNYQKLGYLYNNIGVTYRKQGNTYMALNFYIKAIEELQKAKDVMALAYINANVGNIYLDQEEYQKALFHYTIGYEASIKAGNDRIVANLANSVGLAYDKLDQLSESFSYFRYAYSAALKSKNQEIILLSLSNLGESYADLNKFDSAIYYINQSLTKSIAIGDVESQTIAYLGLGTVYFKQGNYPRARQNLEEGLQLALNSKQAARATAAYEDLSLVMESLGQYSEALKYAREFKHLSDSLSDIKQSNNIELLKAEFEFENEQEKTNNEITRLTTQNEIQNLRLRERNLFIIISIIVFTAVVLIGYLIYKQSIVKKRKEANELKQKLLRLQLNPHFMFNSLNAIQHMVYKNEDTQKTADYLAKFSHLTRQILELNQQDLITLEDEITFIKNYLTIQQIRFDKPFLFDLQVAESVDRYATQIPPMITQPFLENAIEHGIIDKDGNGKITVLFTTTRKNLVLLIEDNGIGREAASFKNRTKKHRSLATKITKDRLEEYQRTTGDKVSMEIEDVTKEEMVVGTRVLFVLPLKVE